MYELLWFLGGTAVGIAVWWVASMDSANAREIIISSLRDEANEKLRRAHELMDDANVKLDRANQRYDEINARTERGVGE